MGTNASVGCGKGGATEWVIGEGVYLSNLCLYSYEACSSDGWLWLYSESIAVGTVSNVGGRSVRGLDRRGEVRRGYNCNFLEFVAIIIINNNKFGISSSIRMHIKKNSITYQIFSQKGLFFQQNNMQNLFFMFFRLHPSQFFVYSSFAFPSHTSTLPYHFSLFFSLCDLILINILWLWQDVERNRLSQNPAQQTNPRPCPGQAHLFCQDQGHQQAEPHPPALEDLTNPQWRLCVQEVLKKLSQKSRALYHFRLSFQRDHPQADPQKWLWKTQSSKHPSFPQPDRSAVRVLSKAASSLLRISPTKFKETNNQFGPSSGEHSEEDLHQKDLLPKKGRLGNFDKYISQIVIRIL